MPIKKKKMKAMEMGAGVAAGIAGALAGAYLLYARTNPQQKKRVKAWAMKARKAAGANAKKLSSISEHEYHRIVEKAMKHYGSVNKISAAEIASAIRDAKSEWKHIKMQAKKMTKPTPKRHPVKKTAKRKAKKRK
jgi:hypothetical protein